VSDLREDPSPEAAFLRELVRAEEADLPSSDKMNELVARLAPMISKPPAAAFSAKRALSTAIVVMVAAGTWLATSDAGTGHETASSPPPVASVATEAEATEAMVAIAADSAERAVPPAVPESVVETPPALPSVDVANLPTRATPARPSHVGVPSSDGCADEVALLDQAGAALRSGDADRAMSLTRDHLARCPSGAFTQERERIAIESLAKLSRFEEMRARAQAFERDFPASPYLRRIEQVVAKYREQ